MHLPLGIELATVGSFQFRRSVQGLLKMFVTQPGFHRRSRKKSGRFAVATTSVLAKFTHGCFHVLRDSFTVSTRILHDPGASGRVTRKSSM